MNIIRYGGPMARTRKVGSPIGYSSAGLTGFVSVWATTAINETITIPCQNLGTFNAVVDWGDSSPPETITTYNGFSHQYDDIGEHTISITGTFPNIYMLDNPAMAPKLKKVTNLGTVGWTNLRLAFYNCINLTEVTVGSTDTSSVTDMFGVFQLCSGLTSLDLSSFDTSSAATTQQMFFNCTALTSLDVSSLNTTSVTNMANMFYNCSVLTSIDVSSFVTSSVTNMSQMFQSCNGLTSIVGVEDWAITGLNSTGDLTNFLTGGRMTTAQYDNLLVKWQAQVQVTPSIPAMTASFGASIHSPSPSAAYTAKVLLVAFFGWTISDGVTP